MRRDWYCFSDCISIPEFSFIIANAIYGPSYISHQEALMFYGLIPEHIVGSTSMTTKKTKKFDVQGIQWIMASEKWKIVSGDLASSVWRRNFTTSERLTSYNRIARDCQTVPEGTPETLFFRSDGFLIRKSLGIGGVHTTVSSWRSQSPEAGAQNDLVIDRRDQVISLCEMKFSIHPFSLSKKYAIELRNKVGVFRTETRTGKSVFLTMITTFGVNKNIHAIGLVQNELRLDDLFDPI